MIQPIRLKVQSRMILQPGTMMDPMTTVMYSTNRLRAVELRLYKEGYQPLRPRCRWPVFEGPPRSRPVSEMMGDVIGPCRPLQSHSRVAATPFRAGLQADLGGLPPLTAVTRGAGGENSWEGERDPK